MNSSDVVEIYKKTLMWWVNIENIMKDYKKYYEEYSEIIKNEQNEKNEQNVTTIVCEFDMKKFYIINRCIILYWILKIMDTNFDKNEIYGCWIIEQMNKLLPLDDKNNIIYYIENINKIISDINIIKKYI